MTKQCSRCGKEKTLEEFYSWCDKKYSKVRYTSYCRRCMQEHHKNPVRTKVKSKSAPVPERVRPSNRDKISTQPFMSGFCDVGNHSYCRIDICKCVCHSSIEEEITS